MGFAITHSGRRTPRASDRMSTADDLDRALDAAGDGALSLWWVSAKSEGGRPPAKLFRWGVAQGRDPLALADEVRTRILAHAAYAYLNGECWVLAHVGAARHGLPVAMVVNRFCVKGEPAHLVLDLGDGRYLDANGVSSRAELLERAGSGARMPGTRLDADGVVALHDRLYAEAGDADPFETRLEDGFGTDTEALFSLCLDRLVDAGPMRVPGPR